MDCGKKFKPQSFFSVQQSLLFFAEAEKEKVSDGFQRDHEECQQGAPSPCFRVQRCNGKNFPAECDEEELQTDDSQHHNDKVFVFADSLERVEMCAACIESVKGNSHHKGCKNC